MPDAALGQQITGAAVSPVAKVLMRAVAFSMWAVFSFLLRLVLQAWKSFSKMLMGNTSRDLPGGVFPVPVSASYSGKMRLNSTHNFVA